ncbi:hypothetical protein Golomagni_05973, partial [Golovinomyces magnicellulatus]
TLLPIPPATLQQPILRHLTLEPIHCYHQEKRRNMAVEEFRSSDIKSLPLITKFSIRKGTNLAVHNQQGKVRDIYGVGDSQLLLVASDRISAFDFLLQNTVQDKGKILTLISHFWLTEVLPQHIFDLRHHFVSLDPPHELLSDAEIQSIVGRSTLVQKCNMFPLEVIVRGYITGTAWKEYCRSGTIHGLPQPKGLERCQKLPGGPIYTPAIKAKYGRRDENISPTTAAELVGKEYSERIQHLALALYDVAYKYAFERGIIIADTKFEFGLDEATDEIVLADELLCSIDSHHPSLALLIARDSGPSPTTNLVKTKKALIVSPHLQINNTKHRCFTDIFS